MSTRLTLLTSHLQQSKMTQTKFPAQDVSAIKHLIQAFFNRVNDNDPQGLQDLFVPNADLTIIRQDPPSLPPSDSLWSTLQLPESASTSKAAHEKESLTVVLRISIEGFVKMVEDGNKRKKGKPPGPVVHEVPDLDATDIKIDGLFAYAWSPFRVTFDGKLHHFGNFVYTLGKVEEGWRFEGLTQNYRRTPGWEGKESEFV